MIDYGFARFPRMMGNPSQVLINNFDTFLNFFKLNHNQRPVFTSTNSYFDFNEYGNPTNVYYEKMFFDIDTDTGCEVAVAHKDCKKLGEFAVENKLPFGAVFSGFGYHGYLFFEPKLRTINIELAQTIKAIQHYLKTELDLKSVNLVCAEPKRLVRVPLSRYVRKIESESSWEVSQRYCTPLTYEELQNMNNDEIMKMSYHPVIKTEYRTQGNKIKIKNFLKDHRINVKTVIESIPTDLGDYSGIDCTKFEGKETYELTKGLIPMPCIHDVLWGKNPAHFVRFSACAFLTSVLSREEAHTFFDKLSHEAEWNDRHNKITRTYQIDNIYDKNYKPYSCKDLYQMGLCIGESCKYYKKKILGGNENETSSKG